MEDSPSSGFLSVDLSGADHPQRGSKRFCLVTSEFPNLGDAGRGGGSTYAEMLTRALLAEGWDVTVLLLMEPGSPTTEPLGPLLPVNVRRLVLPDGGRLGRFLPGIVEGLFLAIELGRLDSVDRFDSIEGANYEGYCWATALRFGDRFKLRMHASLRQHILTKGERWSLGRRFAVWLDGFAARRSRSLITHTTSHAEAMRVEYRLGNRKIDILPHMTPVAPRTPFRESLRWVGYLGSLDRRKGADLFVQAIRSQVVANPEVRFAMIGRDPEGIIAAEVETLGAQYPELKARIVVTGPISDAALGEWWERLDLLVVPSRYESFGLAVIEAFSRAVPVLCTDAEALIETAGNAAAVVPASGEALAAGMNGLIRDPVERRRLAELGYQRFVQQYRGDVFQERLRSIYGSSV